MRYIIVDLEATCWESNFDRSNMEIIELGAVEMQTMSGLITREFNSFVKPIHSPKLSDFCIKLTTIQQSDVDNAPFFPQVLQQFLSWLGSEPFVWGSWGMYDYKQFALDCARHGIVMPSVLNQHVNINRVYATTRGIDPCPMKDALARESILLEGVHHRGIDDARNIAKIFNRVFYSASQDELLNLPISTAISV
jgi:inhibitor of KinA sporulation pathway (predicted exonuclease)